MTNSRSKLDPTTVANRKLRFGFTLLELLTVIAIIGILLALLSMGIQAVRGASRKMSCSNNLRQIGLGLTNYDAVHGCFPAGAGPMGHSPLVSILPYVEESNLYLRLDLTKDVTENFAVMESPISTFRCPSIVDDRIYRTDYMLNRGVTLGDTRNGPWFFQEPTFPRPGNYSNGATETALFAEGSPNTTKYGRLYELPRRSIDTTQDSDRFVSDCLAVSTGRFSQLENGECWYGAGTMNYYHALQPNSRSCSNGTSIQTSLFTGNSLHGSGINVLYADAHVEFVANKIDLKIWQKSGKR